ncbi:hypothetical protein N7G274_007085 [Stereocaulon virgatum]|uniref:Uncharacterized protein n=1 Tax=Stereocaulon virgatum TaxID=373712 RepID=A0ABR4A2K7_9LECA
MIPVPLKTTDEIWNHYSSSHPLVKPTNGNFGGTMEHFELESVDLGPERTIKYTVFVYGNQPLMGFPLFIGLHGGGGATQEINEANMSRDTYRKNVQNDVKVGAYIAARGIRDHWNLHFREESYLLLQKHIQNLLLKTPEEVKVALPSQLTANVQHFIYCNCVYVLGFLLVGMASAVSPLCSRTHSRLPLCLPSTRA